MIEGVVFDLDGTLIDSEPIWQDEEVRLINSLGLHITREDIHKTKGLASIDAMTYWLKIINNRSLSAKEVTETYNTNVLENLKKNVQLKQGVQELIGFWKSTGLPMAIASASPEFMVMAMVDKFNFNKIFSEVLSGDDVKHAKPHPEIYIKVTKRLGIDPVFSVAFEDTFTGLLAAKAARMKAVAMLDEGQVGDTKYDFADLKLESFLNFGRAEFEYLESLM